jgi:probable FeS assembly SUF system protein SufT
MAEQKEVLRDCLATIVPFGEQVVLPSGAMVDVVQALGGSVTVSYGGRLLRIKGEDADAVGLPPPEQPDLPQTASPDEVERAVWEMLRTCYDPEIPIDMVELGLIYDCQIQSREPGYLVRITMTLTAPGCGMGDVLADEVKTKLVTLPPVQEVDVVVSFDPPWSPERMSEAARLQSGLF